MGVGQSDRRDFEILAPAKMTKYTLYLLLSKRCRGISLRIIKQRF